MNTSPTQIFRQISENRNAEQSVEVVERHQYGQDGKVGIEGTFMPKIFKYLKPVFFIRN